MRKWRKSIPPKVLHEQFGLYQGMWMPFMDRYWESDDGYNAMSRQIRTEWGVIEHFTIQRSGAMTNDGSRDIPWSVKQEIKNELVGERRVAIEVFPAQKNLVDICDVYHLWVLPKDFKLPFGIHPTRDPQGKPVERGYDYNLDEIQAYLKEREG